LLVGASSAEVVVIDIAAKRFGYRIVAARSERMTSSDPLDAKPSAPEYAETLYRC